jgi:hypothetical protein
MGCYIVPATAALIHYFMMKRIPSMNKNQHHIWLNLLFIGGATFGVIDHLWNGELFMLGEKPLLDLALGVTITLVILMIWIILVVYDKLSKSHIHKISN